MSVKIIGGYLKSDLLTKKINPFFKSPIFSNGRTCLSLIIDNLDISKIYIPSYICNSVIDLIREKNLPYEVYYIDLKFRPIQRFELQNDEYFLYINYFGICSDNVKKLRSVYRKNFIIDNSMAFFENNNENICFNSARKFFGVSDGAYVDGIKLLDNLKERSKSFNYHIELRNRNNISKGYNLFLKNENVHNKTRCRVNLDSLRILKRIDYNYIIKKRVFNFEYLHQYINHLNKLEITLEDKSVPLYYPLLLTREFDLELLHKNKIFTPKFWDRMYYFDYNNPNLSLHKIIPLPVDQNCSISDLLRIVQNIEKQYYEN